MKDLATIPEGDHPILAGRYRVMKRLGSGGMGDVFLVHDLKLDGREFAVKMLPAFLVGNRRAMASLKREALHSMELSHPNIVTVRGFEETSSGQPFLIMDFIDGRTLDDLLLEKGRLSESELVRIFGPIADALDYAHGKGVIHRDVKPTNIMIRLDGAPVIMDFGVAREVKETSTVLTGNSEVSGTVRYMSPEQLRGERPDSAQDIYSLSATMWECFFGNPPFMRGDIRYQIECVTPDAGDFSSFPLVVRLLDGLSKSRGDRPATCVSLVRSYSERRPSTDRTGVGGSGSPRSGRAQWASVRLDLEKEEAAALASWISMQESIADEEVREGLIGLADYASTRIREFYRFADRYAEEERLGSALEIAKTIQGTLGWFARAQNAAGFDWSVLPAGFWPDWFRLLLEDSIRHDDPEIGAKHVENVGRIASLRLTLAAEIGRHEDRIEECREAGEGLVGWWSAVGSRLDDLVSRIDQWIACGDASGQSTLEEDGWLILEEISDDFAEIVLWNRGLQQAESLRSECVPIRAHLSEMVLVVGEQLASVCDRGLATVISGCSALVAEGFGPALRIEVDPDGKLDFDPIGSAVAEQRLRGWRRTIDPVTAMVHSLRLVACGRFAEFSEADLEEQVRRIIAIDSAGTSVGGEEDVPVLLGRMAEWADGVSNAYRLKAYASDAEVDVRGLGSWKVVEEAIGSWRPTSELVAAVEDLSLRIEASITLREEWGRARELHRGSRAAIGLSARIVREIEACIRAGDIERGRKAVRRYCRLKRRKAAGSRRRAARLARCRSVLGEEVARWAFKVRSFGGRLVRDSERKRLLVSTAIRYGLWRREYYRFQAWQEREEEFRRWMRHEDCTERVEIWRGHYLAAAMGGDWDLAARRSARLCVFLDGMRVQIRKARREWGDRKRILASSVDESQAVLRACRRMVNRDLLNVPSEVARDMTNAAELNAAAILLLDRGALLSAEPLIREARLLCVSSFRSCGAASHVQEMANRAAWPIRVAAAAAGFLAVSGYATTSMFVLERQHLIGMPALIRGDLAVVISIGTSVCVLFLGHVRRKPMRLAWWILALVSILVAIAIVGVGLPGARDLSFWRSLGDSRGAYLAFIASIGPALVYVFGAVRCRRRLRVVFQMAGLMLASAVQYALIVCLMFS